MTHNEFELLSKELRVIAPQISLQWGCVQNDKYDNELKRHCNIFAVASLEELSAHISQYDEAHQNIL